MSKLLAAWYPTDGHEHEQLRPTPSEVLTAARGEGVATYARKRATRSESSNDCHEHRCHADELVSALIQVIPKALESFRFRKFMKLIQGKPCNFGLFQPTCRCWGCTSRVDNTRECSFGWSEVSKPSQAQKREVGASRSPARQTLDLSEGVRWIP